MTEATGLDWLEGGDDFLSSEDANAPAGKKQGGTSKVAKDGLLAWLKEDGGGSAEEKLRQRVALEATLRKLTNKIFSSSLDDILLSVREDIQSLLGTERVTIYVADTPPGEIVSKVKDGHEVREIRLPMASSSIAGHCAVSKQPIRLADAYDAKEVASVSKDLKFDASWDRRSGFRTKQVLAVPVMAEGKLGGVIQCVNKRDGSPFTIHDTRTLQEICETLAIAFVQQRVARVARTPYDQLFANDRVNEQMLEEAKRLASAELRSVEIVLIEKLKVGKQEVLASLSQYHKMEAVEYAPSANVPVQILDRFEPDYLKHHKIVPIEDDGRKIVILFEDPKDVMLRDELSRRLTDRMISARIGIREDILQFIDLFYPPQKAPEQDIGSIVSTLDAEKGDEEDGGADGKAELKEDDSALVKLVNQIIMHAAARNVSDIHIEPYPESECVVRFRIDGVCVEYSKIPRRYWKALVSRIKIMCGLDISERRLPQDGKIKFKNYGPLDIELRVATLPTAAGMEDVVMRILAASKPLPLEKMGMVPEVYERFKQVIQQPYGLVLVVGPTGSGKTTTLHSALGFINQPDTKIWTAEDPVEITQRGLRQMQMAPKIGLTFERALKAFLRADPDVIMVGEMRDHETAAAGIEASLTGHMVFSTLHTNSAPETVTRLLDMGIDPFSFGDSLLGVLAQRLVRTLCKECKKPKEATPEDMAILKADFGDDALWEKLKLDLNPKLMQPGACQKCSNGGYKGRMGIHEFLETNDELRAEIYRKAKVAELRNMAIKYGMTTLKQDGIRKVLQGHTDIHEVRRVCIK